MGVSSPDDMVLRAAPAPAPAAHQLRIALVVLDEILGGASRALPLGPAAHLVIAPALGNVPLALALSVLLQPWLLACHAEKEGLEQSAGVVLETQTTSQPCVNSYCLRDD